jgi:hypothetical protein
MRDMTMARKRIFRDYRPGHKGEFTDESTYNRSQGQGKECNVHGEYIDAPDETTITNVDDLFNMWENEDFDQDEFVEYEFHGTGDTGRRK